VVEERLFAHHEFGRSNFGIFTGGNTSSPYDSNSNIPSSTMTISTSNTNDLLVAGFRATPANSTAGTGRNLLASANYELFEHLIVSATQSGLSVPAANGQAIDALDQGAAAGASCPTTRMLVGVRC
jgi:hypothetical protein